MTAQNAWESYWRSRSNAPANTPEDFPGARHDGALKVFWEAAYSSHSKDARCLDLACGSGIVLRHAHGLGFQHLTGADISVDAVRMLERECPSITGVSCALDDMPFDDQSFDLITSQFGFEYAGTANVASEIARLLAPDGEFISLIHKSGGAIDLECRAACASADEFDSSGFIATAKAFFSALYAREAGMGSDAELSMAIAEQTGPRDRVVSLAQSGYQLARHVIASAGEVFENRHAYKLNDLLNWFDQIDAENRAFRDRMASMSAAAQSKDQMTEFVERLSKLGLVTEELAVFQPDPSDAPIAWIARARKGI